MTMYYINAGLCRVKGKLQFISPSALRVAWNVPLDKCVMHSKHLIPGLSYIELKPDPKGEYKNKPKPRKFIRIGEDTFRTLIWER